MAEDVQELIKKDLAQVASSAYDLHERFVYAVDDGKFIVEDYDKDGKPQGLYDVEITLTRRL